MLNILLLPDGTELTSGNEQTNNIRSVALTECVNSAEDLTIGSTCPTIMEVTAQTPMGGLALTAGDVVTLFKVDDAGIRHQVGLFNLEKPTRSSANMLKLTGYDNIVKLDKDLTAWLSALDGWPYALRDFARRVCEACGLVLTTTDIPNGDYPVQRIDREATGRQLMEWIGQICCRFCRATPYGDIELAWYTPSGVSITPSGDHYIFSRSLSYEDYTVAPIDAVQVRLTDSESGAPIPTVPEGTNSYVISGNPLFTSVTQAALDNILAELQKLPAYTPGKVSTPASLDLHAGHTVDITDINGKTITAAVMSKKQKGQRDTLECTGSPRRDSPEAVNNRSNKDKQAAADNRAYSLGLEAGKDALKKATPEEVFNALTGNGAVQGIYLMDGKVYINAEFAQIYNLVARSIVSGKLSSTDGMSWFDLDLGVFAVDAEMDASTLDGLRLKGGELYGYRQPKPGVEGNSMVTFELIARDEETLFCDGILMPSGLPITIYSSGGLNLGHTAVQTEIRGKTVRFRTGDGGVIMGGKKLTWLVKDGCNYLVGVDE